jgi:hypothetical protein
MAPKAKAKEKVLTEEEQALADERQGIIQQALDMGVRGEDVLDPSTNSRQQQQLAVGPT